MTLRDWLEVAACVAAILVVAWLFTKAIAPRIEAMAEHTTDDDPAEVPHPPQPVDEEPSEVDPSPTLREQAIVILAEPRGTDGTAVKVGDTWVHLGCRNARRDGYPGHVCEYCAPRLAGIPTTGGNR